MRTVGTIRQERLVELQIFVTGQRITEQIWAGLQVVGLTFTDIVEMDEFTFDLVVALPDGLCLVYDTT